jgi:hypothetical protein
VPFDGLVNYSDLESSDTLAFTQLLKENDAAEMPVPSLISDSVQDRELSFWLALPDKLQVPMDHTWPYGAIYLR